MRKGSKVIKIKYEEDSIFVGAAWGRKRTRWGRKGARLTLEAISDYLKKGAGVHSEEAYLDEVKCDLLRVIRKRLYQFPYLCFNASNFSFIRLPDSMSCPICFPA